MRKAGEVTFTAAHQQRRNEGVAEFANKESLERALDELDGSEIHGMKIRSGTSLNSLSGVPASIDPIFFSCPAINYKFPIFLTVHLIPMIK